MGKRPTISSTKLCLLAFSLLSNKAVAAFVPSHYHPSCRSLQNRLLRHLTRREIRLNWLKETARRLLLGPRTGWTLYPYRGPVQKQHWQQQPPWDQTRQQHVDFPIISTLPIRPLAAPMTMTMTMTMPMPMTMTMTSTLTLTR
jgi:hypothetical protein